MDQLFAAAIDGDADARAKLEIEADKLDQDGQTILHIESRHGNTEHVRFILREFAQKNLLVNLNLYEWTALHLAAHFGFIEVVKVLIDAAKLLPSYAFQAFLRQVSGYLNTALHMAVEKGYVDIVKLLVEADPDDRHIQDDDGKTPLYLAADLGYLNIVKVICTTCTALSFDGPDGTALHAALRKLKKGKEDDRDAIKEIINAAKRSSFEALSNGLDSSGCTVLQLAVNTDWADVVKLVLEEDPAYSQHGPGRERNIPTDLIYETVNEDIAKLLTETYEAGITNVHKGAINLIRAIKRRDRVSVIRLLGDNEQVVTFSDDRGWSPLHHAAANEFDSVLGAIIKAQKDVQHSFVYQDRKSNLFHLVTQQGYTSTVTLLMVLWPYYSSAYIATNENGQNILHLAALNSKKETIAAILRYCDTKEFVNKQDDNGDTPLHILIVKGCFVPELIKYKGLNKMVKNKNDLTPLDNFYLEDAIVADQAQIKIALDYTVTNGYWKFWRKSIKRKSNYSESVVRPSTRAAKDAKFEEAKKKLFDEKYGQMKKDLERYKKRTNTQIIVTALITTVTFTVGFTMPGGVYQSGDPNQGLAVLSKRKTFKAFMVSDALTLLLSTCSLFLYFLETMYDDPDQVSKLNAASTGLNIISVMAMMLTFITGTFVVLSHSLALAIVVCLIGSLFFLFVIVLLVKMVYDRQVERNME